MQTYEAESPRSLYALSIKRLSEEIAEVKGKALWPSPYDQDTPEAAYRFLTEAWWTLNEADQSIALVPKKEYIEEFVHEWHGAFSRRQPLIVEKSRRLLISWLCRGLETHQCGLRRTEVHIIDQTHENSAEHLSRIHFSLKQIEQRLPAWHIKHEHRGGELVKLVTHVMLPNGSLITQGHQEAGADQGKGKTIISLEEGSKYRSCSAFYAQACLLTMGKGDGSGGWVNLICNASPNPDYHSVKGGVKAREVLGLA